MLLSGYHWVQKTLNLHSVLCIYRSDLFITTFVYYLSQLKTRKGFFPADYAAIKKSSNNLTLKKTCISAILLPFVCYPFAIRLLSFCGPIFLLSFCHLLWLFPLNYYLHNAKENAKNINYCLAFPCNL